jgi:Tfp pilus assembly protein PilO
MPRNFDWLKPRADGTRSSMFWLQVAIGGLILLNAIALFLYFVPPGGTRRELARQETQLHREIDVRRAATHRLKTISQKVELSGDETQQFEATYFLPRRTAFASIVSELIRMSNAAQLRAREASFTQDPVEGTDDLTLVTVSSNYEGTYTDLVHFLKQVDQSPQFLILDTLNATPQQQGSGVLNISLRFLAIVHEDGSTLPANASAGGPQ